MGKELSYEEFKQFYRCAGFSELSERDFKLNFLDRYCALDGGISARGLKQFFHDGIERYDEETVRKWL